ncbi:MAG: DUF2927 domain-containing protein [Rhodospirillaceae bacterium]|nr:DUF2927 domain-containing protein [Rhodospirillaceae bacterium]
MVLTTGAGGTEDIRYVVDSFDRIVFHAEFEQTLDQRVTKWVDPINVYLDIRAGDPTLYERLVESHLVDIRFLTGLDSRIVLDPADANFFIVFDRDDRLIQSVVDYHPALVKNSSGVAKTLCFGIYSVNGGSEIVRAVIGIPTDRAASAGKLDACVVEEMTQVLGLPNDSEEVFPSIFNDLSIDDHLTELDRTLIRLLYDPALPPGMNRDQALARIESLAIEDPVIAQTTPSPRNANSRSNTGVAGTDTAGGPGINSGGLGSGGDGTTGGAQDTGAAADGPGSLSVNAERNGDS